MNRKLVAAAVLVVALAVAVYVIVGRGGDRARARDDGAVASGGTSARLPAPRRGGSLPAEAVPHADDGAAITATPFQMARGRAMTSLQNELIQRLHACVPMSEKPPRPQPIRIVMERRAEASSPEMQQYMAREVMLLGGNAESIAPEVKACIDQLRGMPVVLFVNTESLPEGDPTIDETFEIPLP